MKWQRLLQYSIFEKVRLYIVCSSLLIIYLFKKIKSNTILKNQKQKTWFPDDFTLSGNFFQLWISIKDNFTWNEMNLICSDCLYYKLYRTILITTIDFVKEHKKASSHGLVVKIILCNYPGHGVCSFPVQSAHLVWPWWSDRKLILTPLGH